MVLPGTKPLDGEFWYILDDKNHVEWRMCPRLRGEFYLGWLGQNKNVVGAGLAKLEHGQLIQICTHGTPYYWLQPYEVLPFTIDVLETHQITGTASMMIDYSLAGWGMRDQTPPSTQSLPEAPIPSSALEPVLVQAIRVILHNFSGDGEPPPEPQSGGLLSRVTPASSLDPLEVLLQRLTEALDEASVVPVLIELVKHDVNVMPDYRQSDLFETLSTDEQLPSPGKIARLVLSAIYHLAPILKSRRLSTALLLNSLRQRHPFDVTWGADFVVKCLGMSNLVRVLQAAALKEEDDQIRGNVLDLLQELGYGSSVGLEDEVIKVFARLLNREDLEAFHQVVNSHLSFLQEYARQRDAAAGQGE